MDAETAKFLVFVITSVGSVAWLAGLVTLLHASRDRRESARRAIERFDIDEPLAPGSVSGEAEVDGQPEDLSTKLAGQLARDGLGPLGPVKIVDRNSHEVAFEPAGPSMLGLGRGRIRLTPIGTRTRVEYAVETLPNPYLLLGWVTLALGLAALIIAPTLAMTLAVSSPNPNVRVQAIQSAQMVHFLWPPFLFAQLSRQPGRMLRARLESLVHNLPYA